MLTVLSRCCRVPSCVRGGQGEHGSARFSNVAARTKLNSVPHTGARSSRKFRARPKRSAAARALYIPVAGGVQEI